MPWLDSYRPEEACTRCRTTHTEVYDALDRGDDVLWTCPDCNHPNTAPAWEPDEDTYRGGDR